MTCRVIWANECPKYIHETHEPCYKESHWTCVVVYFDDILVYSTCLDDHDESLYVNLEKCTFCTQKVIFMEFVIGLKGVQVDKEKVKVIQS
ncbi:hypothetical protein CR513_61663, partial [Mucuna pruriens]